MSVTRSDRPPQNYTTVELRRNMSEALKTVRYTDAVISVSHHGKPWASIISTDRAEQLQSIISVGQIKPDELKYAAESLTSPFDIDELTEALLKIRSISQERMS